jgi:nicotinamide-nucleotide amidase
MFSGELLDLADQVLKAARARGVRIATAESCTGGLVAGVLTEIAGSSDVVECGYVTYANAAKHKMLGVGEALLVEFGAVSHQVAEAMAMGALASAALSVAITGIAGPGGGSADKPVGLVYFATAVKGGAVMAQKVRFGDLDRSEIRRRAVKTALTLLLERLG